MKGLQLLLTALLLALFAAQASAADVKTRQAELERLRTRIAILQQDLQQDRGRYDTLSNELRTVERRISAVGRNLKQLNDQLAAQERRLGTMQRQQRTLEASIADQRRYLAGQIRAAYAMGRQEYIKILLNQEHPAEVGRVLTYYDYLNKARTERIDSLNHDVAELNRLRDEITRETERLRELRRKREEEKVALEASYQDRNKVVERLRSEITDKDQQLSGMLTDEKELKLLLRALTEALEDIPAEPGDHKPFGKLKGKLKWPTAGKRIVAYGEPRKLGKLRWQGVLIAGRKGQDVRAVSHGRIAFADWLRGYGLLIIIDHGDGYMSLYGHNQSLYKETGDWVEVGEAIASVGSSGGVDENALYFEIRKDGQPTDPVRWCRR